MLRNRNKREWKKETWGKRFFIIPSFIHSQNFSLLLMTELKRRQNSSNNLLPFTFLYCSFKTSSFFYLSFLSPFFFFVIPSLLSSDREKKIIVNDGEPGTKLFHLLLLLLLMMIPPASDSSSGSTGSRKERSGLVWETETDSCLFPHLFVLFSFPSSSSSSFFSFLVVVLYHLAQQQQQQQQ